MSLDGISVLGAATPAVSNVHDGGSIVEVRCSVGGAELEWPPDPGEGPMTACKTSNGTEGPTGSLWRCLQRKHMVLKRTQKNIAQYPMQDAMASQPAHKRQRLDTAGGQSSIESEVPMST